MKKKVKRPENESPAKPAAATSASSTAGASMNTSTTTTATAGANAVTTPAAASQAPSVAPLKPSSFTVPSGPSSGNAKPAGAPMKSELSEMEMIMSAVNGTAPNNAPGSLMNQSNLMDPTHPFNSGSSNLAKLLQPGMGAPAPNPPTSNAGGAMNPSTFAIDPLEQSLASLEQNIKADPVTDATRAMLNNAQQQQLINDLAGVAGPGMNMLAGKPDPGSVEMLHQQLADMQQQQFMALNAAAAVAAGGQFDLMNAHQAAMMSAHLNAKGAGHNALNGNANGFNAMDSAHLNGMMNPASIFDMQQQQQQFQNSLMGHNNGKAPGAQGMSSASNSGPATPLTTTPQPSPLAMGGAQVKKEEKFMLTPKPIEQLIMPQHHNAMQEMHMQQHQMNGDKKHDIKGGQPPNFVQAFNNKMGAVGGDLKNASGWSSLASNSPQNAPNNSNNMGQNNPLNATNGQAGGGAPGAIPTSMAGGNMMTANGGVPSVNNGNNGSVGGNSGGSNGGNAGHQMTSSGTPGAGGAPGAAGGQSGGTPTVAKPKSAIDSFQAFRNKAKEKMDRQKYLEQQEIKRMQKEAADKEKRLQEQQQSGKRPDEVDSKKSIDARLDDNSGSSGSPGGGHFATPTDKAAQRRADMRREEQERRRRVAMAGKIDMNMQSDLMAAFEETL